MTRSVPANWRPASFHLVPANLPERTMAKYPGASSYESSIKSSFHNNKDRAGKTFSASPAPGLYASHGSARVPTEILQVNQTVQSGPAEKGKPFYIIFIAVNSSPAEIVLTSYKIVMNSRCSTVHNPHGCRRQLKLTWKLAKCRIRCRSSEGIVPYRGIITLTSPGFIDRLRRIPHRLDRRL